MFKLLYLFKGTEKTSETERQTSIGRVTVKDGGVTIGAILLKILGFCH